jgi:tRNA 2-thiouridine synthesizing protein A
VSAPPRADRTTVLDNRATPCAVGLIRARERMTTLEPGERLVVLSHDRFAPVELPLWAERAGHDVLDVARDRRFVRTLHRITLRKAGSATRPSPR